MEVNADFDKRVLVRSAQLDWIPSPMPGVDRRMLDRIGDEVARATSIVRYAENSEFPGHVHGGGEEFIVLEGVFQDEHGDYPAGTYVRNPPTTRHVPGSKPGCTIFVKLWQFDAEDRTQISLDLDAVHLAPSAPGVRSGELHRDQYETVALEQWDADTARVVGHEGGLELLLLEGRLDTPEGAMERHDWLRLPKGDMAELVAGPDGARLWLKLGHLAHVRLPEKAN